MNVKWQDVLIPVLSCTAPNCIPEDKWKHETIYRQPGLPSQLMSKKAVNSFEEVKFMSLNDSLKNKDHLDHHIQHSATSGPSVSH